VRERIYYRFRVPSATVFTLYSYSKALEYRFRVPTVGSLSTLPIDPERRRERHQRGHEQSNPSPNGSIYIGVTETTRTHGPLYSSSICPSQQDSLLYTQFSCTHPSSIHSIHCGTHLSLLSKYIHV
jgi:hypothetical protein